jgi:hypothetical protein
MSMALSMVVLVIMLEGKLYRLGLDHNTYHIRNSDSMLNDSFRLQTSSTYFGPTLYTTRHHHSLPPNCPSKKSTQ